MLVQLPQKDLEVAANIVSNLIDKSAGPLPVLSNLLIEATESGVQFRGTDIEAVVTVNLNATVKRAGRTTVPADTFRDLVKLLPAMGEVSIEEVGSRVTIQCESNEYKLMTLPAEDFPEWPAVAGETKFQVSQKTLKSLIDATAYALPGKDHRRVLLGVNFELADNELTLTATDGKKLARISLSIPEVEGKKTASIIVPRKVLDNVMRSLGSEGPVEIEITGADSPSRQIVFRFDNVIYRCNGIEGKYPDCDSVIPKEFPTQLDLNRDTFLQAARRAGVVTDEKNKSIILKLEDNQCHFSAMAHDLGQFAGNIKLDYTAPMIELAFNYQFLVETFSRFASPEIKMLIKNGTAPVVFKSKDEEKRLALLMPIKLADIRPMPIHEDDDDSDE